MAYQLEWRGNGVYWFYTGVVTGEDILQSNIEIYGNERFDNLKYQIACLLDAERIEVNERHIQKVAHLDAAAAKSNPNIRVAVVARERDATYLRELYIKHSKGNSWPTMLFDTVEAAETWALSDTQ